MMDASLNTAMQSLLQNVSPQIFGMIVKKLSSYVLNRTMETRVSGLLMANICRQAYRMQPQAMLAAFVPPLCRELMMLTECESVQTDNILDNEILFKLQVLAPLPCTHGYALLPYVEEM